MRNKMNRREFIRTTAGTTACLGLAGLAGYLEQTSLLAAETEPGNMPARKLGRTGHKVSLFSLGGESTVEKSSMRDEAVTIIERALDLGVNYIDTSPQYGRGGSEINIGRVMAGRRHEVFLASKSHYRTYDGTMRLLEESLKRLQTDYLDLYQMHNVRVDDDLNRALDKGGALEAMERLKSEKVIRHIGITGHKDPEVLIRGIEEFDFDTILLSLNAGDIHYKPFQTELLQKALDKNMGVIAMKVTAVNRIFRDEGITSMREALGYCLSFPVSTAIVGISNVGQVEENVDIARNFKPFSAARLAELESYVQPYQEEANIFKLNW